MLSSKLFCVLFFCLGLSNGWPQFDFMNQMGFGGKEQEITHLYIFIIQEVSTMDHILTLGRYIFR